MQRKLKKSRFQKGFSILEGLIASTVLTGVVASAITMQTVTLQRTRATNEKAFATQKAMQMFEELRAYVQANRENDIAKLQNFSDGASYNHVLTTEKKETTGAYGTQSEDLTNPADALSGNTRIPGNSTKWRYLRRVQVAPVANDANARQVTVSVFYAGEQDNTLPKGSADRPLAVISGILKTNISADPPTQMYDLFVIAIENSPSWWVDMADLRPSFERTLQDLEQRNPGLIFRRHFITRNGFGRDPYYMPYMNSVATANAQDLPWVYLYPGDVNNTLTENYLRESIQGRLRSDSNSDATLKPINKNYAAYNPSNNKYRQYALADQFNHVLRFPEQRAMEERLKAEDPDNFKYNPSLVTFLEDMNKGDVYKNSIVINLHGELIPMPPIRNYSNAAKAPEKHARKLNASNPAAAVPADAVGGNAGNNFNAINNSNFLSLRNKRVIANPENLQYPNATTALTWNVHAYEEYPEGQAGLAADNSGSIIRDNNSIPETSLFIPTIGEGPRYSGAGDGFLENYPDFDPGNTGDLPPGLTIKRMVGGRVINTDVPGFQPFEWWHAGHGTTFARPTNNHDTSNPAGYLPARVVKTNGNFTIGSGVATSTLTFNAGQGLTTAEHDLLKGMLIVLNPDSDGVNTTPSTTERVVRVTGYNSGTRVLTFTPAIDTTATGILNTTIQGRPIVRHKDYDARIVDVNMYGQPHRGIKVTLYDTPTRHNCYNDTACGTANAYGGMQSGNRLDGLEYIPSAIGTAFPAGNGTTAADINNSLAHTSTTEWKNSARWKISLDTSQYGTNFSDRMVPIETRIVTADPLPAICNVGTANLISSVDKELCDGIWGDGDPYVINDINTPAAADNEHETTFRPNMYNVSRTYTYMNHYFTDAQGTTIARSVGSVIPANTLTIPKTEQAQFQGHPLYNPYLDVKQLHRYNRHFAGALNSNGLAGFGQSGGYSWDNDNVDLNWFFQLYSSGIMRSNAVYNSISGFSNYYYAFGGEIGTDGTNAYFDVRSQPWSVNDTGTASVRNDNVTVREIIRDGGGGARTIMDNNATTNNRWRMREHLGELYPDRLVAFWRANGNLPTHDFANGHNLEATDTDTVDNRYYRALVSANPRAVNITHRRIQNSGAPSFINGNTENNPASSNNGLQHSSPGGNGVLTNTAATDAGAQLMNAFNLVLSDQIPSNRPFQLNGGGSSGGYSHTEIASIRNRLKFVNTTTGAVSNTSTTQNVYYRHDSSPTSWTSSAFVKLTRPNPSSTATDLAGLAGYVLVNGFNEAGGTGTQEIARFSQAASLQTFMDAGDRAVPGVASGRTVQLPRVKISDPRSSQVYENPTAIGVNLNVAWLRWDEKKYSPAYPADWRDSTPLLYNVKYSTNNKATWKYADDKSDVPLEYTDIYNSAHSVMGGPETSAAASWNKTYSWDVASLPEGNYVLRVEVYREGFNTGYSYHDVFVTISR